MNKIILTGRLCADPEIKQTPSGTVIATYRFAANRAYKREGQPDADFFNCKAFGKAAEFVERYLKKGMKIAIIGHVETGSYTNKDGVKIPTFEVLVDEHEFLESKAQDTAAQPAQGGYNPYDAMPPANHQPAAVGQPDDDLPF